MKEYVDGFDNMLPTTVVDYRARKEYVIEELIGEGGFGRCYKLIRRDNNKCYAGKIIKKEYPYTGDQRRQVHQEARIHYHLDHPNIGYEIVVLSYPGEKIAHICGTPNYISPEVINREGYSFGVDVWGLGCLLYTLLVGKVPFEGGNKDRVYYKIMNHKITFPKTLDIHSLSMIRRLLTYDPGKRPNIGEVLKSDYLNKGLIGKEVLFPTICNKCPSSTTYQNKENDFSLLSSSGLENIPEDIPDLGGREDLRYIHQEISKVFKDIKRPVVPTSLMEGALDYKNKPMSFVFKWCDFSDKYGLGYQLSDSSIGAVFNDRTLMVHREKKEGMVEQNLCVERNGGKHCCYNYCDYRFRKKAKIIEIFKANFNNVKFSELTKVKNKMILIEKLPFVTHYKDSSKAIGFLFSNKSLQVNFFEDHIKVIVSPLMGTISIIDEDKQLKTYNMKKLSSTGWDLLMAEKMYYIKSLIDEWTSLKRRIGGDANNIPVKVRFNNCG
uniref:Serine/threonine-protein kinase PLK n=1 Tax=Strongyloides papillosus TaxID=174720 RepID=A0A0N5CHN7_STREA